jgi:hypothetical protein
MPAGVFKLMALHSLSDVVGLLLYLCKIYSNRSSIVGIVLELTLCEKNLESYTNEGWIDTFL